MPYDSAESGAQKTPSDKKVLEEARDRLRNCISAYKDGREKQLDDLRFCTLDQWPADIRSARENDPNGARPCLTPDQINQYLSQVVNDMRQKRPSIKPRPVDNGADVDTAEIMQGVIRQIEDQSQASVAYETAAESAVRVGEGYFRIITEYEDALSFNQVIKIIRLPNMFNVYLGPHIMPDGSDAEYGFILERVSLAKFKREFPGKKTEAADFEDVKQTEFSWGDEDEILVAEYFYCEYEAIEALFLEDGTTISRADYNRIEGGKTPIALDAMGKERSRKSHKRSMKWCKLTGIEILDKRDWAGKYVPIVKMIGKESWVDGKRIVWGLVRPAKDALRAYNYWLALSLDTQLPTPRGWVSMANAAVGDELFDETGKPCKVTGISPIYINHDCYSLKFDDGSEIIADAKHLWTVHDHGKRRHGGYRWVEKIVTTDALLPEFHRIQATLPLELRDLELTVHPYVLGVWLGDGDTNTSVISQSTDDIDDLRRNISRCGYAVSEARRGVPGTKGARFTVYGINAALINLGLRKGKHIPGHYLRASKEQRFALLQGLMDTDGSIGKANRQCSFTTSNELLAQGFAELLRSLGIKAISLYRDRISCVINGRPMPQAPHWQFSFSCGVDDIVFRLPRKRTIQTRARILHHKRTKVHRIVSVTPVPSVPVKCVTVDSASHLYLAGASMIPTHNSTATEKLALSPRMPFVGAVGQFATAGDKWAQANRTNFPYLEYDVIEVGGQVVAPPQRVQPSQVEAGIMQFMQVLKQDVEAALGMYKASLGREQPQQSGRAILALTRESDTGTFHFSDNQSISVQYAGRILIDLIPKIYDTARILRIIGDDGEIKRAEIDPNQRQAVREVPQPDGSVKRIYNPGIGTYDVAVTTGPSYNTRRMESAQIFTELANSAKDPASAAVMRYLAVKNSDFNLADEAVGMLKKLLPPQLVAEEGQQPIPPQIQAKVAQLTQIVQVLGAENQQLKSGQQEAMAKVAADAQAAQAKVQSDHDVKMKTLELERVVESEKLKLARDAAAAKAQLARWEAEQKAALDAAVARGAQGLAVEDQNFEHSLARVDQSIKAIAAAGEEDRAERELSHDQHIAEEQTRIKAAEASARAEAARKPSPSE